MLHGVSCMLFGGGATSSRQVISHVQGRQHLAMLRPQPVLFSWDRSLDMLCVRHRLAEDPEGLRSATAPLPKVSSAQEDESLLGAPKQGACADALSPFALSLAQKRPFEATADNPDIFQTSSLFQSACSLSAPMPAGTGAETSAAKPASHTVHQDKIGLPARVPTPGEPLQGRATAPAVSRCFSSYASANVSCESLISIFAGVYSLQWLKLALEPDKCIA